MFGVAIGVRALKIVRKRMFLQPKLLRKNEVIRGVMCIPIKTFLYRDKQGCA